MTTLELSKPKIFGRCALLLLLGVIARTVQAGECTYGTTAGDGPEARYAFSVPSTIALTGTEATGTVLWSSSPVIGSKLVYANCTGGSAGSAGLIDNYGHTSTSLAGSYNVYPTNVPGIGFAISFGPFHPSLLGYPSNPDGPIPQNNNNSIQSRLLFIKTSDTYFSGTSAQTNMFGDLATWYVGTNRLRFANFTISDKVTFTKPGGGGGGGGGGSTCRIPTVNVPLGAISSADLMKNRKSQAVRFTVSLIGCSSRPQNITYALSPLMGVWGRGSEGKMGTTNANVGVEIKDSNGNPVEWYDYYQLPSDASVSNSGVTIPFTAAMVTSGTPATPGRVFSSLIAEIIYK